MEYRIASFGERALALFIDAMILALPGWIISKLFNTATANVINNLLGIGYETVFLFLYSSTPGKKVVNLKVVAIEGELDLRKVLLRSLVPGALFFSNALWVWLIFALDYLWYFHNPEGRTLHDLAGQTRVVKLLQ
ncbi:RDD family protein [Carboxydocella sp. JDF658]|uniref:RDD family protein n=1 Tax=Carboxydocella sp. JDF658 TaxID=1926600 RepID=UPI0009AE19B3|nr:RDD family protein [Carboxydocella sp. JDF658]GAW32212.1 RDD family protein [Carboxydocella sp. JDF658]